MDFRILAIGDVVGTPGLKFLRKRLPELRKEKKELVKKFKVVIEDLLDNYEKYTDEEKEQVKEVFRKVAELNAILDKYDIDVDVDWNEYITAYDHYFGMTWY